MDKKSILVPIDESEGSLHSLDFIKKFFPTESVTITLINVQVILSSNGYDYENEIYKSVQKSKLIFERSQFLLKNYEVKTYFAVGHPAKEILSKAKEDKSDVILMPKSNKRGLTKIIGSVTSGVLKGSECLVMIVP